MTPKNNEPDADLTKRLLVQRKIGMLLVVVGVIGIVLTPLVLIMGDVAQSELAGSSGQDTLTEEERQELQEAVESNDFDTALDYSIRPLSLNYALNMVVRAALFGLPALSFIMLALGGYLVTTADKKGHLLELDDYPDNPSVRDEFRKDDS